MTIHRRTSLVVPIMRLLVLVVLVVGTVGAPTRVYASTWTVDSLADGAADADNCPGAGGTCRLRDAILKALPGDTISFSVSGTITLTEGQVVVNKGLNISGPGASLLTIDANDLSRVIEISGSSPTVVISGLTLTGGKDTFSDAGGGMYMVGTPTVFLDQMAIRDNVAGDGTSYNWGGGLYVANGTVTITNSEISGNVVSLNALTSGGGGIFVGNASVSLSNTTVSNNFVSVGGGNGHGGGIMLSSGGTLNLTNVTIAGNSASLAGGGLYVHPSATLVIIQNTIIANNAVSNFVHGSDCETSSVSISSQDYNLIGNTFLCTLTGATSHNVTGSDPLLGGLAFNGAQTQSHELLPGSPAIGTGGDGLAPPTDQRGVARPQGLHSDIGAFEAVDPPDCYVDASAPGADDGSSWNDAYLQLYSALGDISCLEIWVATGVYKPGASEGDSFEVDPGVSVFGGFAGGETNLQDRDWDANLTVLSGDLDGDDTNTDGVVLDYTGIVDGSSGNSDHVVTMDGTGSNDVTAATMLDGFTVTAGQADGTGPDNDGGGLLCNGTGSGSVCSPTLAHLTFSGNMATDDGGAALFDGHAGGVSNPNLTDVEFSGNAADFGGAIYGYGAAGTSSPTYKQVSFLNNDATDIGGAMYNDGFGGGSNYADLTDVVFTGNTAVNNGGAVFNDGGNGASSPTFYIATFTDNTAGDSGGAIYNNGVDGESSPAFQEVTFTNNDASNFGGAIFSDGDGGASAAVLTDVTIQSSNADFGAGMYNDTSSPTLLRVTFDHNDAATDGGGMYNDGWGTDSSPVLTNVTFYRNSAVHGGGMENSAGNGISSPVLRNVTFNNNDATYGGAIRNYVTTGTSAPILQNVILWGNQAVTAGNEMYNEGDTPGAPTVSYSVVAGGCLSILGTICGVGNVSTNPKLDSLADNGGMTQTMGLLAGSSAIDSGADAVCNASPVSGLDQRGIARPQGPHCDIGAFELEGPTISGNTLGGASLNYGDGTAVADGPGDYSFTVPTGWSGTVTPALPHYFFGPVSRSYVSLGGDQTGQDYVAYPYVKFAPDDGASVCRTPYIVVKLVLSDLTRNASGAFNKSTVTFKLDGGSVLNLATIRVPQSAPNSWAHLVYKPSSNLSLGSHTVAFMHPEDSGPVTDTWNFTAANIACTEPALLSASVDGETLQDPGASAQVQSSPGTRSGSFGALNSSQASSESSSQTPSTGAAVTSDSAESAPESGAAPAEPLAPRSMAVTDPHVLGMPHPGLYLLLRGLP